MRLSVTRGASRGGVVLVVEVEERGTIVINELFPSTSAATAFWGGADISETNFLGRGINLGGGFVAIDDAGGGRRDRRPRAAAAHDGAAHRRPLRPQPLGLGLYNDGSEFYRLTGPPTTPTRATSSRRA